MRFEGKVTIVTGAGQGIGRAIAQSFAVEGAAVVIADVQEDKARGTAEEIEAQGGKAMAIKVDITSYQEVTAAVNQVLERFGKVDILVNNAGWDKAEPFIKSTEETWEKVIAINYKGPIYFTRAVLDSMIERQYGKIVNISSDAGRVGSSGEAVYSGCKGAVIAFAKTLARELVRYNINVNAVAPGPTETGLIAQLAKENSKLVDALRKAIPKKRLAKPEEIAPAVLFLASDEADYITGQVLSVSGGLTMS